MGLISLVGCNSAVKDMLCSLWHLLFKHSTIDSAYLSSGGHMRRGSCVTASAKALLLVQVGDMRAAWKKIKAAGLNSDAALRCVYMQTAVVACHKNSCTNLFVHCSVQLQIMSSKQHVNTPSSWHASLADLVHAATAEHIGIQCTCA